MKVEHRKSVQHVLPPADILRDVERSVMEAVETLPPAASYRTRRQRLVVSGITVVALTVVMLFSLQGSHTVGLANTDFTESRIIQPNLTSIWLTPVQTAEGN